jgi:hypothetical protein
MWIVNHFVARLLMNFIATKLFNPIMSLDTTRRSNLPDDNFSLPFHERCFCRNSLAQFFVLDTDSDGFLSFHSILMRCSSSITQPCMSSLDKCEVLGTC